MEDKGLEGKKEKKEEEEKPPVIPGEKDVVVQKGTTCLGCGVVFDREKVFCPRCGLRIGEGKHLPSGTFISPVERVARGVGILPLLSLVLGILGPIFFGVGWILAIVFGLISLSAIRKRGGFARDKRMALGGVILGFFWPVVISSVLFFFSYRSVNRRRISRNEASAISDLRNIALTERFAKSGFFFDRDNDGVSEYGALADLAQVSFPYFDVQLVSGKKNGYLFGIDQITEEGFLAVAIPLTYGVTGRRTFFIDQGGILTGEDIGGKDILEVKGIVPKIFPNSVFDEFDDEIAGDLLQKAKQEAKERNFDKARKVLEEIRSHYYLSPASREVESVMDSIATYVAEDKSKENFQEAKVLIDTGEYREALALLKATKRDYPGSSFIPEVRAAIGRVERKLAESEEREARELFARGQELEVEGKYEEALKIYEKIRLELSSTSYFERVGPLLNSVRKKIEEGEARTLFARLGVLKPGKDWAEILRIVGLLRTGYGETDLVKSRQPVLDVLQSRSSGQKYKNEALEELRKRNYQAALESLENALQADSSLTGELRIFLQTSHLRLGDKYFREKNYEKAVVHYEDYLTLTSAKAGLERGKYNEAYYQLGKIAYEGGELKKAKENFLKVRYAFRKRPELYYLLGSILAGEKDYQEALGYLNTALKLEGRNGEFFYKRGLCQLAMAWQLEDELSELLLGKEDDESLKRGGAFVDAVANIINEAEAKGIQLELQERPRILERREQLTPQQIQAKRLAATEREKHLAKMRAEAIRLKSNLQQNKSRRMEIVTKMRKIYERMVMGGEDLKRAVSLKGMDPSLGEIINLLGGKKQLFDQGRNKMEIGLDQERFIEERAFSALRLPLRAFKNRRSLSGFIEEIGRIYGSISMSQVENNLREGRGLLGRAKAMEIQVEGYLTPEVAQ